MQALEEWTIQTNVRFMSAPAAVAAVPNEATMMVGGFGLTGIPERLLEALVDHTNVRDITVISNNIQETSHLYRLFQQGRLKKAIGTYFTTSKEVVRAYNEGRLEVELMAQGTMTEACRLGGAGIPAFYTPTGAGTELALNKETRSFDGQEYVLERSLIADVALIKAYKADRAGNVVYRKSARNFNPVMATAARYTIVEVDEVVEIGELDPEAIATPFIFVDAIVNKGEGR